MENEIWTLNLLFSSSLSLYRIFTMFNCHWQPNAFRMVAYKIMIMKFKFFGKNEIAVIPFKWKNKKKKKIVNSLSVVCGEFFIFFRSTTVNKWKIKKIKLKLKQKKTDLYAYKMRSLGCNVISLCDYTLTVNFALLRNVVTHIYLYAVSFLSLFSCVFFTECLFTCSHSCSCFPFDNSFISGSFFFCSSLFFQRHTVIHFTTSEKNAIKILCLIPPFFCLLARLFPLTLSFLSIWVFFFNFVGIFALVLFC